MTINEGEIPSIPGSVVYVPVYRPKIPGSSTTGICRNPLIQRLVLTSVKPLAARTGQIPGYFPGSREFRRRPAAQNIPSPKMPSSGSRPASTRLPIRSRRVSEVPPPKVP